VLARRTLRIALGSLVACAVAPALAAAAPTLAVTASCSYSGGEFAVVGANFARGGKRTRALVWLTLPLPRDDQRRASTSAVNSAMLTAAEGLAGVKILRLDLLFTPDGYRNVIRYRGRDVAVRDADGIHLNVAGTAIAAKVIADELRHR